MVAPVTGPFPVSEGTLPSSRVYRQVSRYKQAKPIDRPLPYIWRHAVVVQRQRDAGFIQAQNIPSIPQNLCEAGLYAQCTNVAYDKLKNAVSAQAQMGVALAELGQSTRMITTRLTQLAGLARAIRKGDLSAVTRVLRDDFQSFDRKINKIAVGGRGKSRKVTKGFAGIWLETVFGWLPAVQDIYSSIDVLQNPIKSIRPSGSGSTDVRNVLITGSKGNWQSVGYHERRYEGMAHVKMGCEVSVSNPNLYLANNLGLVNPGTIAWELIPFSFVVDWFVNVEQFLSQGTDFLGLSVTNTYTTRSTDGVLFEADWNPYQNPMIASQYATYASGNRNGGLSGPTLKVRPFKLPSWRRAATASALLVQVLSK